MHHVRRRFCLPLLPGRWSGVSGAMIRPLACSLLTVLATVSGLSPLRCRADEPPPVSASDSRRVFVSGVQDSFDGVRAAIEKARAESGREYRVTGVGDAGGDADAATRLLEKLVERWRDESAARKSADGKPIGFDPGRDVTIVLDITDKQIAMRAPWGLEVSSGLDPKTIETELIKKAFVPRAKDGLYDEGLSELVGATERWVRDQQERKRARAEAERVFRTRTLPIGLAALAGFGGLTAFFLQRARHDRRMHEARKKLAAFKEEVVSLSDLLDGQQERHRMLPHSDPDFQTPMQGMTRSAYDGVQSAIRRYRERWLSLMDVWEKAEEQIQSEWFLGTAAADDAIRLLDSADARPPLTDVAGECRAPLDALEQAHEKSRALVTELEGSIAATTGRLEQLAKRGRSGAAFQGPMAEVARGLALARQDVESDPIASRGRLEETAALLARTTGRIEAVESADDRRDRARLDADGIEQKIRARRAEGWLLAEPGANPDALVESARREVGIAMQLLDAGEADGAIDHVERAERANAEALALLENIVAAKARVDDLLPGCLARLEALAGRRGQAERALAQMAASCAERSWADLADNVAKADEGIERVRTLIAEAQAAADRKQQHYFRAVALVEEAVRQEDWIEGCYGAITDRRAELDQLRASLPQKRDTVRQRVIALSQQLERQRTDRVRANERCREAGRLVEVAGRGLGVDLPDLPEVGQLLDAADTAAARATDLAAEDERLARQAFEDLEETDNLVRRVTAWYAEGVSADTSRPASLLEEAKALLSRQRYEDSIKTSAEAAGLAQAAYAAATTEAERRRIQRLREIQQRQLQESFTRMSRGSGPWVIQLPGGSFTGPDPWRSMGGGARTGVRTPSASRTAGGGWSNDTVQVGW